MWPLLLDMTKEESIQNLRNLELEAYSNLVSALRAQGPLNPDKRKLLKDTSFVLNITQERHKAEVRRAISDEKLNTIAYHITGHTESLEDWAQEGRRVVPLLPRSAPQTIYSAIANDASESASQSNKILPLPSNTERKRPIITPITATVVQESSKSSFRIPEPPKVEDSKKRKLMENSVPQHLLTPKLCRIQQLYRQRSKPKSKDLMKKPDQDHLEIVQQHRMIQPNQQSPACSSPQLNQRVNVLQNISLQPIKEEVDEHEDPDLNNVNINSSNENQAPKPKLLTNLKPNACITIKQTSPQPAGPSNESKTIKMCPSKKAITKTVNSGQKLIVVSSAQTIPSSSILQRSLQIPFVKNISIKNFDKFKIVTSNSTPTSIQLTNSKQKVVTVKTNSGTSKKVIPFSQLQVLNSKGSIKVLPIGGKIVGKSVPGNPSSSVYIMNTTQQVTKVTHSPQIVTTSKVQDTKDNLKDIKEAEDCYSNSSNRENGKSSVLEDILKASGVVAEDNVECSKVEEFHVLEDENNEKNIGSSNEIVEKVVDIDDKPPIKDPDNTLNENLITEEVPLETIMEMPETKISDTECN